MNGEHRAMGINVENADYKWTQQSNVFVPSFQLHEMIGHSISSPLPDVTVAPRIVIHIDTGLLAAEASPPLGAERSSTLTERLNDAYDQDAEREDEEFFRSTREYYRRRLNA